MAQPRMAHRVQCIGGMTNNNDAIINVLTYDADQNIVRVATAADIDAARDADLYVGTFACPLTGDTVLLDADVRDDGSYDLVEAS